MTKYNISAVMIAASAILISGCLPGLEPDKKDAVSALAGDWKGMYRDDGGVFRSLTATINDTGKITALTVYSMDTLTGTLKTTGDKTYSFTLSDGTEGGFMADSSGNHLGFLTEDNAWGILEKGASIQYSADSNFSGDDFVGTWNGYSVELDSYMKVADRYSSRAMIYSDFSFSGSNDYGSFSGNLNYYDHGKGYSYGTFSSSEGSGNVGLLVSPDKSFMATWACDSSSSGSLEIYYITGCSFAIWNK